MIKKPAFPKEHRALRVPLFQNLCQADSKTKRPCRIAEKSHAANESSKEATVTKRFTFFCLLLIAALVLIACATAAPAEEAAVGQASMEEAPAEMSGKVVVEAGGMIRIGGSFALTGPIPTLGLDIRQGAELAIDDLNAAGGLEGFMFELVAEDGACDGTQGTNVGNKFASDETIVSVTGGTCSGETFGLMPILQEARIPFVSPSATNPDITSSNCDVCNRVALSDALQGATDARYVFSDLGLTKVAVVHDNSDYGKGVAEVFQNSIAGLGGDVTSFEGVQVGDTDFRAMLARVGAGGPEAIFFGGYATEAGLIAQQMTETPGLEDTVFMSVDGAFTQQYLPGRRRRGGRHIHLLTCRRRLRGVERRIRRQVHREIRCQPRRTRRLPQPELRFGDADRGGNCRGRFCGRQRQSHH